jgi:hypothetical protein
MLMMATSCLPTIAIAEGYSASRRCLLVLAGGARPRDLAGRRSNMNVLVGYWI